jgi:tetratricopeptide (TPR) repeat protein
LQSLEQFSLQDRLANALVSYVKYMAKMIWPGRLAVYYPHPLDNLPAWQIAGAILLLASMTILVVRKARSHPYLIVGWLWFLGTLVPVIGIVQVGGQAMADRYTYVPLIGLFISMAWGISSVVTRWPRLKAAVSTLTVCVISLLMISTWFQLHHWKNSIVLFEHALNVTSNNQLAHNNLGLALSKAGRIEEAIEHFSKALLITPQYVHAHINMGNALKDQGNLKKAEEHYRQALSFVPDDATAKNNLGIVIAMQGRTDEAVALFSEVLRADPDNALAHNNMGIALAKSGEFDKAIEHFSEALRINPDSASARRNLEQVLTRHGD